MSNRPKLTRGEDYGIQEMRYRPLHDEVVWKLTDAEKEIADLKASNERLADSLAAAKERAGE